jgi:SAM-dependent methyltransferase
MRLSLPFIRQLSDADNPKSYANKLRAKRFGEFEKWVAKLPRPIRMLDVGGSNGYWNLRGWAGRDDIEIVTLNTEAEKQCFDNIQPLVGDLTNLERFADRSFDLIFSNSVIEHLFSFENQRRMASEVRRVGKSFWVQSPNYWFPLEPHFQLPGWQWMPVATRVALIQRWQFGKWGPYADPAIARNVVEEVRLLTKSELKDIFPGATLLPERFCGLVKSWNVVGGLSAN